LSAPAKPRTRTLLAIVAVWLCVVVAGLGLLFAHSVAPGSTAEAPEEWPDDSVLSLDAERHTLVFVAHPQCVCTRASVAELARLVARLDGKLRTQVLFVRPDGTREEWERSDLWLSANAITNVDVVADPDGREAERFGARTSGQAYLFAPTGALLFAGGITASRGHEGPSLGRDRIVTLVEHGAADGDASDVFGCALFENDDADTWVRWVRQL
jgi:hypothetical protein